MNLNPLEKAVMREALLEYVSFRIGAGLMSSDDDEISGEVRKYVELRYSDADEKFKEAKIAGVTARILTAMRLYHES